MRYMFGQFVHAYPDDGDWEEGTRRNDWADIALKWYDRELKEEDVDVGPDTYVQDSTGDWRAEEIRPQERSETETWYLQPEGTLSRDRTDDTDTEVVAVDPARHQSIYYPGRSPTATPALDSRRTVSTRTTASPASGNPSRELST